MIMCVQELDTESGYGMGVIEAESTPESEENELVLCTHGQSFIPPCVKIVNPQRKELMEDF